MGILVQERRQEHQAIEVKRAIEQEVKATRARRHEVVVENFIRSPRCWNVNGAGYNGKLGGCDGLQTTCQLCFEYNAAAFATAKVEMDRRLSVSSSVSEFV